MTEDSSEVVLITGFPRFRARKLLEHLLAVEQGTRFVLIVPPKALPEARELLRQTERAEGRTTLFEGDPSTIDFGLSGAEYRELAESVVRAFHLYQVVDPHAPALIAQTANIGGTREMIEFCRVAKRLEVYVHFSSVSVTGTHTGIVREDELMLRQTFRNDAEETLARAELMLQQHSRDVRAVVLRVGQLVGDSRTGEVDRLDGLYPLVAFFVSAPEEIALPLPQSADALLPVVPIDYVVRAAHCLAHDRRAVGKTFHLVDPEPLMAREFLELVAARCNKRLIPGSVINNPGVRLLSRNTKALIELMTTDVHYDTFNTRELLSGASLACPPLRSYLSTLIEHVQNRVREKANTLEELHDTSDWVA
jgi:thioester reductase-like protein